MAGHWTCCQGAVRENLADWKSECEDNTEKIPRVEWQLRTPKRWEKFGNFCQEKKLMVGVECDTGRTQMFGWRGLVAVAELSQKLKHHDLSNALQRDLDWAVC